jgi:hypothetical protein
MPLAMAVNAVVFVTAKATVVDAYAATIAVAIAVIAFTTSATAAVAAK